MRRVVGKTIYISHPFGGKRKNLKAIEKKIKQFIKVFPNLCFISPVHTFGFLYNIIPYEEGLWNCKHLLSRCDEMWVFGDFTESKGCMAEIEFCKRHDIPMRFM